MTLTSTSTAQEIHTASVLNDGGTFDRLGRQPRTGYAVTRKILDTPVFLGTADVAAALSLIEPDQYVGTWLDRENGRWEVSITEVFEDREDALLIAAAMSERYVYDLDAQECVAVREETSMTEGITEGARVRGEAGVFYADRAAEGEVLNFVGAECAHVALDDGDRAVVPTASLTRV